MSDVDAAIAAVLDDRPEGSWRARAVAALRPHGAAAIPAVERAVVTARGIERDIDWRGPRHVAVGLALARLQIDAGLPLSVAARAELREDLERYEHDDLAATRDILLDLDEATRTAIIAAPLQSPTRRAAWLAYTAPATLPRVLGLADELVVPRYDHCGVPQIVTITASFGAAALPTLLAALPGASSVTAEVIVRVMERLADPAAASALVEALGHGSKPVRLGALAALQAIGAPARAMVEEGRKSKKKVVRGACAELLSAFSAPRTRADAIASALAELDDGKREELEALFHRCCTGGDLEAQPWYADFAAKLPEHGVLMLAAVARRIVSEVGDSRVAGAYGHVFRLLARDPASAGDAAWLGARALASLPKVQSDTARDFLGILREAGAAMVAPLASLLEGPAFPLRSEAFELLAELDPRAHRGVFLAGLADSSKEVRSAAAKALAVHGAEVAGPVAGLLGSKKDEVRAAAAALLAEIASPAAKEAVARALAAETKADVAAVLERALAASGGAAAPGAPKEEDEAAVVAALAAERRAKLPKFLALEALPVLTLRSGATLGGDALLGLLSRLMNEGPEHVDGPARRAKRVLDAASANAFSVAIEDQWARGGGEAKHKWAVYQQAILVSEARLNEVAPRLDDMASAGQHHLAAWYVDVLSRHGEGSSAASSVGLSWIAHWTRHADTRSLRTCAVEALQKVAEARGVGVQALVAGLDAYVADDVADAGLDRLGLDAGVRLDFGARAFTARLGPDFDLQIRDAGGKVLVALPTPGKKDDAALAEEARETYGTLKKALRAIVDALRVRLEAAMISGRPWAREPFERLFVHHPIAARFGGRLKTQA